jgi:hypothetical protein
MNALKISMGCVAVTTGFPCNPFMNFARQTMTSEKTLYSALSGVPGRVTQAIPGTLPFIVTTNAIMKYNSIACKVLTELVLARPNSH